MAVHDGWPLGIAGGTGWGYSGGVTRTLPLLVLVAVGCGVDDPKPPAEPGTDRPAFADAGPDVDGAVGTAIAFDGSASTGASFRWDFGDGQIDD